MPEAKPAEQPEPTPLPPAIERTEDENGDFAVTFAAIDTRKP